MDSLEIAPGKRIEAREITERFIRSGGPGGQHVNKTATAVELRFEAADSPNLTAAAKDRLKRLAGRRWTHDGAVIIKVTDERSQAQNRAIARNRLAALIRRACAPAKPRVKTKTPAGEKRKRLDAKRRRAAVKTLRRLEDTPE